MNTIECTLTRGTKVYHRQHGVGTFLATEKVTVHGTAITMDVFQMPRDRVTLRLSTNERVATITPLKAFVPYDALAVAARIIAQAAVGTSKHWHLRKRDAQDKLAAGTFIGLCRAIRDLTPNISGDKGIRGTAYLLRTKLVRQLVDALVAADEAHTETHVLRILNRRLREQNRYPLTT